MLTQTIGRMELASNVRRKAEGGAGVREQVQEFSVDHLQLEISVGCPSGYVGRQLNAHLSD